METNPAHALDATMGISLHIGRHWRGASDVHRFVPAPIMKKTQKCPKCASTDIVAGVELSAGGANTVHLVVFGKQLGGLVQPVEARSKATSYVCSQCGFVEIYADTPSQFRRANR